MPNRSKTRKGRKSTAGRIMPPIDVRSMSQLKGMWDRIASGPITFVLIYADWCGHCHRFKPEFDAAASMPGRSVNVVSVNDEMFPAVKRTIEQNSGKPSSMNVEGYPTVLLVDKEGKTISSMNTIPDRSKIATAMRESGTIKSEKPATVSEEVVEEMSESLPRVRTSEPPISNDMMDLEVNETEKIQRGGSLYASMGAAAYQIAPAALLMGISSLMKKGNKKGSKKPSRKQKRRTMRKRR
jgi:thiol-disulfide isomerase/thioredoxin